jgi:sugar lactone lactonase YvrE
VDLTNGTVTTIAGTGSQADRLPGPGANGTTTALAAPWDVLVVGKTLYIAMAGVHQIWTLDLETNAIAVFAGTSREGIDDGARTKAATLAQPSGLATDGRFLYWVDAESSSVRKVALSLDTEGQVETLVGTGLFDFGDKDGSGTKAQLQHAQGIAYADGVLYVADTYNHKIRAVDAATRNVTTVSGDGQRGWADGPPADARYDEPGGLSAASGEAYVADTNNDLIRVIDIASGQATTLQLSNLDVANAATATTTVTLAAQSVGPGTGTIDLTLTAPDGYHLNSLAPTHVEFHPNGAVQSVMVPSQDVTDDGSSTTVSTPATFQSGTGPFLTDVTAYYCRTGAEALCLVQRVEISIPVTTTDGGGQTLTLNYVLPPAPTGPKSP